jgi:hypothetical protein
VVLLFSLHYQYYCYCYYYHYHYSLYLINHLYLYQYDLLYQYEIWLMVWHTDKYFWQTIRHKYYRTFSKFKGINSTYWWHSIWYSKDQWYTKKENNSLIQKKDIRQRVLRTIYKDHMHRYSITCNHIYTNRSIEFIERGLHNYWNWVSIDIRVDFVWIGCRQLGRVWEDKRRILLYWLDWSCWWLVVVLRLVPCIWERGWLGGGYLLVRIHLFHYVCYHGLLYGLSF